MVGAEYLDHLLPKLEQLPHKQMITDLEAQMGDLQEKVNQLKEELNEEKKANLMRSTR